MDSTLRKKKSFTLPIGLHCLVNNYSINSTVYSLYTWCQSSKIMQILVMAPINGLKRSSIDIAIFVLLIGGFLGVTTKTGALGCRNRFCCMQNYKEKN